MLRLHAYLWAFCSRQTLLFPRHTATARTTGSAALLCGGDKEIMQPKLCPKIILEGTRLTHKTEIAFALNEHNRIVGPRKYRYHSPLISAEWCAFTNFPWGRGLINFEPQEEALAMETYHTWARLFELQQYYSWIIDRFHLSTQMYQLRTYGKHIDFIWLEDRLLPLGFRLIFCTRSADSFEAARAERLKVSGKPAQYDDLKVFLDEQAVMKELVAASHLPKLTVDISDSSVTRVVEEIADWLEQTGGLYIAEKRAALW
ncbi:MAG: hypothetical protein H6Q31_2265 [Bacteroidetes bacterium]|nr:hypothetical protein [Bacteroidota bacterium]